MGIHASLELILASCRETGYYDGMNTPQRLPPGPVKRYDRYFTIPINKLIFVELEKLKWRMQLDKTEVVRRLIDYFLTMPPESQDKIVKSFDTVYVSETQRLRDEAGRRKRKADFQSNRGEDLSVKIARHETGLKDKAKLDPVYKLKPRPIKSIQQFRDNYFPHDSKTPEAPLLNRLVKRSGLP